MTVESCSQSSVSRYTQDAAPTSRHDERREHAIPAVVLRAAYAKAERVARDYPPIPMTTDETGFPKYSKEKVAKDCADVERVEEKWARDGRGDQTPEGRICEAFLLQMLDQAKWFGDARVQRTAKYDDYFNHIDALMHMPTEDGGTTIGVSFDVTSSTNGLKTKLGRIRNNVAEGKLGTVKYARTPTYAGPMNHVPEFVLFASRARMKEICEEWLSYEEAQHATGAAKEALSARVRALKTHEMRLEFLYQAVVQLRELQKDIQIQKNGVYVRNVLKNAEQLCVGKLKKLTADSGRPFEEWERTLDEKEGVRMLRAMMGKVQT